MVGTIGFAGSRAREQRTVWRWWWRLGIPHLLALTLAGAMVGIIVGFLGSVFKSAIGGIPVEAVTFLLLVFALLELLGVSAKYVSRARQVPLSWKHVLSAPASAALYGAALGFGLTTTVYFWNFPALLALVFAIADLPVAIAAGAVFGLGRFVPVLASLLARDVDILQKFSDRLSGVLLPRRWTTRVLSVATITPIAMLLVTAG